MLLLKFIGLPLWYGSRVLYSADGFSDIVMIVPFDAYYDDKRHLEKVYHRGQQKIWDGVEVLDNLLEKYPNPNLGEEEKKSLKNILSIILWGEYVAWNVSSEMSSKFSNYGAKMAAVSQAHDEARHFYVMRNYLQQRLDYRPTAIFKPALRVLDEVSKTNSLAKKLLGLQLMIEPVALTIFRFIRLSKVDPVLEELLEYYEIDEARHIALGVKYLPELLKKMSFWEKSMFIAWQIKLVVFEIKGLKSIENDLRVLGIDPRMVFEFAENKQMKCLKELSGEMGVGDRIWKPVVKIIDFQKKMSFYPHKNHHLIRKVINCFFDSRETI